MSDSKLAMEQAKVRGYQDQLSAAKAEIVRLKAVVISYGASHDRLVSLAPCLCSTCDDARDVLAKEKP